MAILQWVGDMTNLGYELVNILLFVMIQPALILLFSTLWMKERLKGVNAESEEGRIKTELYAP